MEAPALFTSSGEEGCVTALAIQQEMISRDVCTAFGAIAHSEGDGGADDLFSSQFVNNLELHAAHRRTLYRQISVRLSHLSDGHYFYKLLMWCHDHHVFIHPCVEAVCERTVYRDHRFFVREDVAEFTPLLAIPEELLIGFNDPNTPGMSSSGENRNCLYDAAREKEFHSLNVGECSDADICQFFFTSLGMIVSDLVTAKSSPLTDARHTFADLLGKVRTLKNAAYFEDDVVFDPNEPCLADVLLQMIRNYVNGGPYVNKVPRHDLLWAVSVCLSHSTPLSVGTVKSIGIIPMVHLFPHGGKRTNTYVVARTGRERSAEYIAKFFRSHCGFDFSCQYKGRWVYVVPERALKAGEEICLQAMAPVCERDEEAEQMWKLSCGSAPEEYMSSSEVAERQARLTQRIVMLGAELERKGQWV